MYARNTLRNRKTGESFEIDSSGALIPLHTQSIFTKKTDFSQFEQFIQQFSATLPETMSTSDREKIVIRLRQEKEEISAILNNSQAFAKLMTELVKQIKSEGVVDSHSTSIFGFLKLLGSSLLTAKLNTVFPGLAFLALNVAPAAAGSAYTYFEGQPTGGEDLCANLVDCIQGYLTELGKEWEKDLPQIARVFEQAENSTNTSCIPQRDMQAMLSRAYRGPNENATNCTINAVVHQSGNITVMATNVDPDTCDIMKDSVTGLARHCNTSPPSAIPFPMFYGLAIGIPTLAVVAFTLYKCKEHQRAEAELLNIQQPLYLTV